MRQMFILFSLVFSLLYSCTTFAKTKKQDLIVEIVLEKINFMISEPIDVKVKLTNVSDKDIICLVYHHYGNDSLPVNEIEPKDGVLYIRTSDGHTPFHPIKPKTTDFDEFVLNEYVQFTKPGDYSFNIVVHIYCKEDDIVKNKGYGYLLKKPIQLHISNVDENKIDGILTDLYQKAIDPSTEWFASRLTMWKIAFMRTPRATPYFSKVLDGKNPQLRYAALEGLGYIRGEKEISLLKDTLEKTYPEEEKNQIRNILSRIDYCLKNIRCDEESPLIQD